MRFLLDSVPDPHERWQVGERIQWIRLPLPFALNHVNSWLLGEPGNQVLVDTGVATTGTRRLWQQHWGNDGRDGLARVPERLLVTHFHPDHMGLAGWFGEAGVELSGSAIETAMAQHLWSIEDAEYAESYALWYLSHGLPQERVAAVRRNANTYRKIVHKPPAQSWSALVEGQMIELGGDTYQVMIGRGHAPDMLMLYRRHDHILIAADQVLPGISPNVSVMPQLQDSNPLRSFLQTLEALKDLPEDTLVLPSHGAPFRGLHQRLAALEAHHEQRLDEVRHSCRQSSTAFALFSVLFQRELDAQQMSFALGESLAHLHYLEQQGELGRQSENGVVHFFTR